MGRLGEACTIQATITARNTDRVLLAAPPIGGWCTAKYCRTGEAEVAFIVPSGPDCFDCEGYADIDDWATELTIWRDGIIAFVGPVTRVSFQGAHIIVHALDLSAWWSVRTVAANTITGTDLSTIFEAYHAQAMTGDPIVGMQTVTTPTGILADRTNLADMLMADEAIRSLTEQGAAWTMFERYVLVNHFAAHLPMLTDQAWNPTPQIVHEGRLRASRIVLTGGGTTVPAIATADTAFIDRYGLIVRKLSASDITNQAELQQMADALLAYSRYPILIDTPTGSALSPDAPIDFADLIPGSTVTVDTSASCRTLNADFIIDERRLNMNGTVELSLAPVGARVSGRYFWPKNLGDLFRQLAASL